MRRVPMLVAVGLAVALLGGELRAEDKLIGAVWELHVKLPGKDKYESKGLLRCTTDGKVYRDGKVIGSHKNTGLDDIEIKIDGLDENWNSVTTAKKVGKDGKSWEGVSKREKGDEVPVRLFLKKD